MTTKTFTLEKQIVYTPYTYVSAVTPEEKIILTSTKGSLTIIKCDYSNYTDQNVIFKIGNAVYKNIIMVSRTGTVL